MTTSDVQAPNSAPIPTVADVKRISAIDDPILRNLQITQCYHDLAQSLARRLPEGANWCTVATWASRQAGQSIRRQDLRRALARLLQESADANEALVVLEMEKAAAQGETTESFGGAVVALGEALNPLAAFDRVSAAVARGNLKVFAEIGREFARFLELFDDGPPTAAAVDAFGETLRDGDPPDGQRYLRQAFSHYHQAITSVDEKERAELMLLANLEIGFHEQTRLQPEIRAAMDAPVYDPAALRRRLLLELFPDARSRLRLVVLWLTRRARPLLDARDRLAAEAQRLARHVVTEHMMTLEMPRGRLLRLGRDVPAGFPAPLQTVTNADLLALLAQIDLTPDSQAGTGTVDWSELPQRIHYIADLFRAYHLEPRLADEPFTASQLALIREGRVPADL